MLSVLFFLSLWIATFALHYVLPGALVAREIFRCQKKCRVRKKKRKSLFFIIFSSVKCFIFIPSFLGQHAYVKDTANSTSRVVVKFPPSLERDEVLTKRPDQLSIIHGKQTCNRSYFTVVVCTFDSLKYRCKILCFWDELKYERYFSISIHTNSYSFICSMERRYCTQTKFIVIVFQTFIENNKFERKLWMNWIPVGGKRNRNDKSFIIVS